MVGKTVLIAEDDEDILRDIEYSMTIAGFDKTIATQDGQEALTKFEENSPDLVITDLMMPVMDGLGLIKGIRSIDKDTPIIVISGINNLVKEARKLGVELIIGKPFDCEDLAKEVRSYFLPPERAQR